MFVVVAVSAGLTEALSVLERVGSMFVLMDLQRVQVQLKCALS